MRAAFSPHLSDAERRALAAFAVLAGGFVIVSAVAGTAALVATAEAERAGAADDRYGLVGHGGGPYR